MKSEQFADEGADKADALCATRNAMWETQAVPVDPA
jgi:hypothetical protein